MAKASTQLLVDPSVQERIRALALVTGRLQSDTLRRMVEDILPALEAENATGLAELAELLDVMKVDRGRALEAMLKAKLPVSALRGRKRFPLPLG